MGFGRRRLRRSPGLVGALEGTNERGQRRRDWPSAPGPWRFPGRCRRQDHGGRSLEAAPFWRTGAHRSWTWRPPSLRAWARPQPVRSRATAKAGPSDWDRGTLRPRPQSGRLEFLRGGLADPRHVSDHPFGDGALRLKTCADSEPRAPVAQCPRPVAVAALACVPFAFCAAPPPLLLVA